MKKPDPNRALIKGVMTGKVNLVDLQRRYIRVKWFTDLQLDYLLCVVVKHPRQPHEEKIYQEVVKQIRDEHSSNQALWDVMSDRPPQEEIILGADHMAADAYLEKFMAELTPEENHRIAQSIWQTIEQKQNEPQNPTTPRRFEKR